MATQKKVWGGRVIGDNRIVGVDICEIAYELARFGNIPSNEHVQFCPVCTRRFLIEGAGIYGFQDCRQVVLHLETMAKLFADTGNVGNNQVFLEVLAHFATADKRANCSCEGDFASMIAAELATAPERPTLTFEEWKAGLPDRLKAHQEDTSATDGSQQ